LTQVVPYPITLPTANSGNVTTELESESKVNEIKMKEIQRALYTKHHDYLCKQLKSNSSMLLKVFPSEIHHPYPLALTCNTIELIEEVTNAMVRGINAVVANYFNDDRFYNRYLKLPPNAVSLLRHVQELPYELGSWRPDMLFPDPNSKSHSKSHSNSKSNSNQENSIDIGIDVDVEFQICEINARYPCNGYYVSFEQNNVMFKERLGLHSGLEAGLDSGFNGYLDDCPVTGVKGAL